MVYGARVWTSQEPFFQQSFSEVHLRSPKLGNRTPQKGLVLVCKRTYLVPPPNMPSLVPQSMQLLCACTSRVALLKFIRLAISLVLLASISWLHFEGQKPHIQSSHNLSLILDPLWVLFSVHCHLYLLLNSQWWPVGPLPPLSILGLLPLSVLGLQRKA